MNWSLTFKNYVANKPTIALSYLLQMLRSCMQGRFPLTFRRKHEGKIPMAPDFRDAIQKRPCDWLSVYWHAHGHVETKADQVFKWAPLSVHNFEVIVTKRLQCRRNTSRIDHGEMSRAERTYLAWLDFRHYSVTVATLLRRLSAVLMLIPELQKYLLNLHTNTRCYGALLALLFPYSSGGDNQVPFLLLRETKPSGCLYHLSSIQRYLTGTNKLA